MTGKTIGKQAVVIGAGASGLAAAGALADYFERVIILERDRFPSLLGPRLGTPRGKLRGHPAKLPGERQSRESRLRDTVDIGEYYQVAVMHQSQAFMLRQSELPR